MKIVMVGAGNVSTHFTRVLQEHGHDIIQIYSHTEASAQLLANRTGTDYTTQIKQISSSADLYIVSLKDAVLADVLPQLVRQNPEALYIHTAGSIPMSIWQGLTGRYGVVYPMQTFSKNKTVDFSSLPIFIEANNEPDAQLLYSLFSDISSKVRFATSEQRQYLHLAAVFACNFSNNMLSMCQEILQAHGLPFDAMLPLIDETASKVHFLSPVEAQTGPAQRNDINVMNKHLDMLNEFPHLQQMYQWVSQSIRHYEENHKQLTATSVTTNYDKV